MQYINELPGARQDNYRSARVKNLVYRSNKGEIFAKNTLGVLEFIATYLGFTPFKKVMGAGITILPAGQGI